MLLNTLGILVSSLRLAQPSKRSASGFLVDWDLDWDHRNLDWDWDLDIAGYGFACENSSKASRYIFRKFHHRKRKKERPVGWGTRQAKNTGAKPHSGK